MDLTSERNDLDNIVGMSGGTRPARAGLRMRPADAGPTGVFVVVEMTVLVLVAALAMASIIVSGNETADREPAAPAARSVAPAAARDGEAPRAAGEALRSGERRRSVDGIAR